MYLVFTCMPGESYCRRLSQVFVAVLVLHILSGNTTVCSAAKIKVCLKRHQWSTKVPNTARHNAWLAHDPTFLQRGGDAGDGMDFCSGTRHSSEVVVLIWPHCRVGCTRLWAKTVKVEIAHQETEAMSLYPFDVSADYFIHDLLVHPSVWSGGCMVIHSVISKYSCMRSLICHSIYPSVGCELRTVRQ